MVRTGPVLAPHEDLLCALLPSGRTSFGSGSSTWIRRLVFLNETGVTTEMTRLYGRAGKASGGPSGADAR